jgi:RNA polymerase sigma-70 factor, ECF subfamily
VTDVASREWLQSLRAGATRNEAVERLHALLLRAARYEAARRRRHMPHVCDELEEIAHEAAGDALISVVARLGDFRGESRFTTWAYKFAVLETAVKLRRHAWQGRELPLEPEAWNLFSSVTFAPDAAVEPLSALRTAVDDVLTPRRR